ncbi:uncharacterized protein LOC110107535, partial [Dendrobium catenatum]|uniref:uncharacterized protein LOC110107535 n=1 Tax=Dendrobium catenatum TaxID=906689 RepID=UPI00109FBD39
MEVEPEKQVKYVACRLKSGASAWWLQLMQSRRREGKGPVRSWWRMKQLLRGHFLPTDYEQMLYLQYQHCVQGSRTVSDYTEEFYRLGARNNLNESTNQLVARYVGGLREAIQDKLELNTVWSVSQAVNYALKVETQLARHSRNSQSRRAPELNRESGDQPRSNSFSATQASKIQNPTANNPSPAVMGSKSAEGKYVPRGRGQLKDNPYAKPMNIKCFRCFQQGHKSNECPTRPQLQLVEAECEDPRDDVEDELDDSFEEVGGDVGEPLICVLQKLLLSPRLPTGSQRNALFRTKCTVNGKVCTLLVDSGCTENVVSRAAVEALQLKTSRNSNPYKVSWVKKGVEMEITELCRVPLSIGKSYASEVVCDVIDMDVCHIILGRPWQFDVSATHDCRANTYTFDWKGKSIRLLPNVQGTDCVTEKNKSNSLVVSGNQLLRAWRDSTQILALVVKEQAYINDPHAIPESVKALLKQFQDIGPEHLPAELPPMRNIQHQIDLTPGASLPNLPHYKLSPAEHRILQQIVDELLEKQLIQHSLSPCAVPALLVPKKDGSWRMCVDSRA